MKYLYRSATQASMVTAALLICSAIAQGQSRTIRHNTDTQSYVLTYDEQRLRGFDMGQIVWLSPWYGPDAPSPYFMGRSESGQPPRPDKGFYAAPLEFGTSKVRVWDAETFEARAQQNLLKAAHDVDTLRSLKLPSVLEPVRAYLLEGLQFSLKIQELRSGYIKTGNVEPLRGVFVRFALVILRQNRFYEACKKQLLSMPGGSRVSAIGRMLCCNVTRADTQSTLYHPGKRFSPRTESLKKSGGNLRSSGPSGGSGHPTCSRATNGTPGL